MAAYAASKWAAIGFSDSVRLELEQAGHDQVKVTTVCPTYINTGMFDGAKPAPLLPILEPADVEPAQVRTSELTVMMMQLVASGRGVCCLPNWALHEYSSRGYVTAKRLGDKGLYCTLFAAIRADMLDAPFMRDFLLTAKDTSFATLAGVSAVRG